LLAQGRICCDLCEGQSVGMCSEGVTPYDNESPRQRLLKTFRREPVSRIVWQPRIYYWYYGNRLQNELPEGYEDRSGLDMLYEVIQAYDGDVPDRYRNLSMIEIYNDLRASPRYAPEVLGIQVFKSSTDPGKVKVASQLDGETRTITRETPLGTVREVTRHGYHIEHPVKSPQDMKVMQYILDHTDFQFDAYAFQVAERAFGERGVVQTFYPRSPLQRLIISYIGFENTIYALADYPNETHDLMRAIEAWDDQMYEVIGNSPLEILNFGENIDAFVDSPRLFSDYLLPYYNKRVDQMHQKGKFCHIHMDGALRPLLPLIKETHFDGIEAATPLPQGDVTLEEIKEGLGNKILLDGIPAIYFLPNQPVEELETCATKILEMFSPNLILGVSDEVPPPADIERVRIVTEIVERFEPKVRADHA
jgi:hypothetical protein